MSRAKAKPRKPRKPNTWRPYRHSTWYTEVRNNRLVAFVPSQGVAQGFVPYDCRRLAAWLLRAAAWLEAQDGK